MNKKWLCLTIVGMAAAGFAAGLVVAQEGLKYPYLPERYSQPASITEAEWCAAQLIGWFNTRVIQTTRLKMTGCTVFAEPAAQVSDAYGYDQPGLFLSAVTETQPGWHTYQGIEGFSCPDQEVRAAYQEVAKHAMGHVRGRFPEIADKDVRIGFIIQGDVVAWWEDGKMTLLGEYEAPSQRTPADGPRGYVPIPGEE